MAEPIPFTVTRYRCPTCPRTGSSKARLRAHSERCWNNPDSRSCKTCEHFEPAYLDAAEQCAIGEELPVVVRDWGETTMPRLNCPKWAAARGGKGGQR